MKQCCKNCKFFQKPTELLRGLCNYYNLPTVWNKGGYCEKFRGKSLIPRDEAYNGINGYPPILEDRAMLKREKNQKRKPFG